MPRVANPTARDMLADSKLIRSLVAMETITMATTIHPSAKRRLLLLYACFLCPWHWRRFLTLLVLFPSFTFPLISASVHKMLFTARWSLWCTQNSIRAYLLSLIISLLTSTHFLTSKVAQSGSSPSISYACVFYLCCVFHLVFWMELGTDQCSMTWLYWCCELDEFKLFSSLQNCYEISIVIFTKKVWIHLGACYTNNVNLFYLWYLICSVFNNKCFGWFIRNVPLFC